ncbi:MAG TPA: ROK family protein, partial [Flavobacteriaceae bacterium]|nr:ROK family protein [Flavobacteriaceae bacterium]
MHNYREKGTYYLGVDIGGSHIAIGVVDIEGMQLLLETVEHHQIDSTLPAKDILNQFLSALKMCIDKFPARIDGIGISIPGPFDYENGISHMMGLNKYDALFGVNIKLYLQENLKGIITDTKQIAFLNDADSFVLGETYASNLTNGNVMGVTLGTGIGSGFIIDGNLVTNEKDVPYEGNIYNLEFKNRRLEDWISTKWFLDTYAETFGAPVNDVKTIAIEAENHQEAKEIFEQYGQNLGVALASITKPFNPNTIIVGGSISKSYHLFQETFENGFNNNTTIHITKGTSNSAMLGAVIHLTKTPNNLNIKRNSQQDIMPVESHQKPDGYNVYPTFELSSGSISIGIKSLVEQLPEKGNIIIDGYLGAYWDDIILGLSKALNKKGISHMTYAINAAYKDSKVLKEMLNPYHGGDDPVFGKIFPGTLNDFFDKEKLEQLIPEEDILNIIYGPGAALSNWPGKIIYIDTPKNELQFQARSGSVLNLGNILVKDKKQQYKRMYFIDWPVLNKHKQSLLSNIDYIIDSQFNGEISWATGETLRKGLKEISSNAFRVRPWFEPGIWGGDWIKSKIEDLPKDVPNYAWSFELIVPENGIVLSKDGVRLEVSFDFIMFYDNKGILGDDSETFGTDFP